MKLYIARHGQTGWNLEMRAQGRKDQPLNDTGREQAHKLGEKIANLDFEVCYASPLKRAAETAEIAVNGRTKIIYDERLLERSFGDFEGEILDSWAQPVAGVNIDDIALDKIEGNVEPVKSMLARVEDFLSDLKQKYDNDAKILIVGHGAMSKAFDWYLTEHKEGDIFGVSHLSNGEVKEYEV